MTYIEHSKRSDGTDRFRPRVIYHNKSLSKTFNSEEEAIVWAEGTIARLKKDYIPPKSNCYWCGSEFKRKGKKNQKFCSKECRTKYFNYLRNLTLPTELTDKIKNLQTITNCYWCGKQFQKKSIVDKFCSHNCGQRYRAFDPYSERGIKKICKRCGNEFVAQGKRNVFCSSDCLKKIQSRSERNARKIKLIASNVLPMLCEWCKAEIPLEGRNYRIKKICSDKCRSELKSYKYYVKSGKFRGIKEQISADYLKQLISEGRNDGKLKKIEKAVTWKLNAIQSWLYWLFNLATKEHIEKYFEDTEIAEIFIKYLDNLSARKIKKNFVCRTCGGPIQSTWLERQYCSKECFYKARKLRSKPRRDEIKAMSANGMTQQSIADILGITPASVHRHIHTVDD